MVLGLALLGSGCWRSHTIDEVVEEVPTCAPGGIGWAWVTDWRAPTGSGRSFHLTL